MLRAVQTLKIKFNPTLRTATPFFELVSYVVKKPGNPKCEIEDIWTSDAVSPSSIDITFGLSSVPLLPLPSSPTHN